MLHHTYFISNTWKQKRDAQIKTGTNKYSKYCRINGIVKVTIIQYTSRNQLNFTRLEVV